VNDSTARIVSEATHTSSYEKILSFSKRLKKQWYHFNSTTYYRGKYRTLGYKDENGTWHGLVRAIVKKQAEVGINLLGMNNERLDVVNYLPPILSDK